MKKKGKILTSIYAGLSMLAIKTQVFAQDGSTIGTAEVTEATENIKRVITSIAMPLGGVLIFASVVVAALKMIANSNNPQKRSESIGSLAWICGGGVVLRSKFNYSGYNYKCCNKQFWNITWKLKGWFY